MTSTADAQGRNGIAIGLLLAALLANGYTLQIPSFAGPALVADWQIDRAALSPVFSATLLGIVAGASVMGWAGDRWGRRRLILWGSLWQGLTVLLCALATDPWQLTVLRFLSGLGLGGVVPNAVSLTQELAPKRWQVHLTALVLIGMPLGSALPAPVAAWLLPTLGWPSMFLIGGGAALLVLLAMLRYVPESASWLQQRQHGAALRTPDRPKSGLPALFHGELALVTPCLWLMMAGSMMALHVLTSWLPLLLADVAISPADAAGMTGAVHLGGTAAALTSIAVLGRLGLGWVMALFALGAAGVSIAAFGDFSPALLWVAVSLAGFGIVGSQGALGTIAAQRYPSSCRPTGVGMAIAVGRLGSVVGPLLGGALHASGLSTRGLFSLSLWPLGVGLASATVLAVTQLRRRATPLR
jgi:MFS transporter, AAHS family, 4-hydroxybenzoate transporter